MNELKAFLMPMSVSDRTEFAVRCGTSWPFLRNVIYGQRFPGEKLCVAIERETVGAVSRRDLRPLDWWLIWPELVTDEFPIPRIDAANDPQREAA